jgi:hypothetical protein
MASENLQRQLEAIPNEQDAEIALLMEQRTAAEEAMKAAHLEALETMREANATQMQDVQYAGLKWIKWKQQFRQVLLLLCMP